MSKAQTIKKQMLAEIAKEHDEFKA